MTANEAAQRITRNVGRFFTTDNRSMMGGWTRPDFQEAEKAAAQLDGAERKAAEEEIAKRVERERAQFGSDYNVDKPA